MTIAVTGATGHLGGLIIDRLLATTPAGDIVAVVRNPSKASALADRGVTVRSAAYTDSDALEAAFAGVDTLMFVSSSEAGQRVEQHRTVIDAAAAVEVGRVVYTSIPHALTTTLVLAPEHRFTEEYLSASGLPSTILRNNWYTENYAGLIETVRQTGTLVAAAGSGRVASASRADFAAAAAVVLTGTAHEGKIYELGGDHAWDYVELAAVLAEIVGAPVTYRSVDVSTLAAVLQESGLDAATAGFVAQLEDGIAQGALAEATGELSALIGRPTTALIDGLKNAVA